MQLPVQIHPGSAVSENESGKKISAVCKPAGIRAWSGGLLSVLAFVALAGCGGGGGPVSAAAPAPLPTPTGMASQYVVRAGTWAVIGSSTAAGNGAPAGKAWVPVLGEAIKARGVQFVNIAKPGSLTYNGLSSSTAPTPNRPAPDPSANIDQALSRKPVAVLLSYPTNDIAAGYSADEVINNLMAIRATALAASTPVMVLSTQPRSLSDAQRAILKEMNISLAAKLGPCFINVYDSLAGQDGRLLPSYDSGDGIHPNEAGHQVIASTVQSAIQGGKCIGLAQ